MGISKSCEKIRQINLIRHKYYFKAGRGTLAPRVLSYPSVGESSISPIQERIVHRIYRKIPKISPSKYKPPKPVTQKTLRLIPPPNISSPGACTWKIALRYKVKQSKNGKIFSNYKASPIDFEMQISLRRKAPPNISPSKNKPLKNGI